MNRWLAGCLVVVIAGCSGSSSTTGGGSGGSAGGGTGGGSAGGGSAGGGTGGGSTGGGTGGGTTGGGAGGGGGSGGGTVTPTGPALISLTAGENFTCAVLANKTAKCWGRGGSGQLGNGTNMAETFTPVAVMGLTTAKQISAGYEHACAVLDDGTARCWGGNGSGQLGNNSTMGSNVPVTPMGLANVASIHAGVYTTCALTTANQVFCWGRGGDLGDGLVQNSLVPKSIPNLADVKQLSVAPNSGTSFPNHVCGVRMNGTAFCWGLNADGQLGNNSQVDSRVPVAIVGPNDAGLTDVLEITAGGAHGCARRTAGLYCWGFNPNVGDGTIDRRFLPTAVAGNPAVDMIEAGNDTTLARLTDGGLIGWGRGSRGQFGDNTPFVVGGNINQTPKPAGLGIGGVATLFAQGGFHSCAYVGATTVTWCWGSNDYSEIGFDFSGSRTNTPDFVRW